MTVARVPAIGLLALALLVPASPVGACEELLGVRVGSCRSPSPEPTTRRVSARAAARAAERQLARHLAAARQAGGRRALQLDDAAAAMARAHARRMARAGDVFHNSKLTTAAGRKRLGRPRVIAENVGVGPSPASLHAAFMRSPGHRSVILHRGARYLGVGIVKQGRNLWAVQLLLDRRPPSASTLRRTSRADRTREAPVPPVRSVRRTLRAGLDPAIGSAGLPPAKGMSTAAPLLVAAAAPVALLVARRRRARFRHRLFGS